MWFYCEDFAKVAGQKLYCCESCHVDWDEYDMNMCERYSHEDEPGTDDVLAVCCSASSTVDESPVPWAKLREAHERAR